MPPDSSPSPDTAPPPPPPPPATGFSFIAAGDTKSGLSTCLQNFQTCSYKSSYKGTAWARVFEKYGSFDSTIRDADGDKYNCGETLKMAYGDSQGHHYCHIKVGASQAQRCRQAATKVGILCGAQRIPTVVDQRCRQAATKVGILCGAQRIPTVVDQLRCYFPDNFTSPMDTYTITKP